MKGNACRQISSSLLVAISQEKPLAKTKVKNKQNGTKYQTGSHRLEGFNQLIQKRTLD